MDELFESFVREKRFLTGVSKNTIKWYRTSWAAYKKAVGEEVSKQNLKEFVIKLKERGCNSGGVNNYVRGLNVYLTWLFENEHTKEHLKIKKVKEEQVIIETFNDKQLGALIHYRPRNFPDTRLHTMLLFAIDTGCRIEEILTLKRQNVNLESYNVPRFLDQ